MSKWLGNLYSGPSRKQWGMLSQRLCMQNHPASNFGGSHFLLPGGWEVTVPGLRRSGRDSPSLRSSLALPWASPVSCLSYPVQGPCGPFVMSSQLRSVLSASLKLILLHKNIEKRQHMDCPRLHPPLGGHLPRVQEHRMPRSHRDVCTHVQKQMEQSFWEADKESILLSKHRFQKL